MVSNIEKLEAPPREVPFSVMVYLAMEGVGALLFGWIGLGIAMIGFWSLTFNSELCSGLLFNFSSLSSTIEGQVETVKPTSSDDGETVEYLYSFIISGVSYHGVSYGPNVHKVGDKVVIDYNASNPSLSNIRYFSKKPVPGGVGLSILLFVAIGVFFIYIQLKSGIKIINLLKTGMIAEGQLISEKLQEHDEGPNGYRLVYQFTIDNDLAYNAKDYTTSSYSDKEIIFYNPNNPYRNGLLKNFSSKISISKMGKISSKSLIALLSVLFIPAVVVIWNLIYLILKIVS